MTDLTNRFPSLSTTDGTLIEEGSDCAHDGLTGAPLPHFVTTFWGGRRGYAAIPGWRDDADATRLARLAGYTHFARRTCACSSECEDWCLGVHNDEAITLFVALPGHGLQIIDAGNFGSDGEAVCSCGWRTSDTEVDWHTDVLKSVSASRACNTFMPPRCAYP